MFPIVEQHLDICEPLFRYASTNFQNVYDIVPVLKFYADYSEKYIADSMDEVQLRHYTYCSINHSSLKVRPKFRAEVGARLVLQANVITVDFGSCSTDKNLKGCDPEKKSATFGTAVSLIHLHPNHAKFAQTKLSKSPQEILDVHIELTNNLPNPIHKPVSGILRVTQPSAVDPYDGTISGDRVVARRNNIKSGATPNTHYRSIMVNEYYIYLFNEKPLDDIIYQKESLLPRL